MSERGEERLTVLALHFENELASLALLASGHPERIGPWVPSGLLGRGEGGPVYLATRPGGPGPVALRVLAGAGAGPVLDTAAALAGFEHPAVVPVRETGSGWIATAVSEGVPVSRVLARLRTDRPPSGRESAAALLKALAPVVRAVAAVHERGLFHGGISPRKIDLLKSGALVLRDFGFEPTRAGRPPDPSRPPLGSAAHLAPEQAGAPGEPGPATDLFALASVAAEIASGTPLFTGRTLTGLLDRIRRGAARTEAIADPLSPEAVRFVRAALAVDPAARPTDLAAFAAALETTGA